MIGEELGFFCGGLHGARVPLDRVSSPLHLLKVI